MHTTGATQDRHKGASVSMNVGSVPSVEKPMRRRRTRGPERAQRSSGMTLLASTSDLNFSVLSIEDSFQRLTQQQQLRLYYITQAIREAQKLAFLQSSRESPAILLLFQELFSSREEELSPGELILELQKTCFAKGLTDAVSKFFKYAALFYHNSGNYDLLTGAKILPELPRFEFQEVVFSSRAFAQRRGLRLQRAMDACLDAIYSSSDQPSRSTAGKSTRSENPGATTMEATIVPMNERLGHPFYGPGVTYMDAVRIDRTLDQHGILKINTRIFKGVDDALDDPHATFHVFQASLSPGKSVKTDDEAEKPAVQTLMMANQDQIQLYTQDYGPFLAKIAAFLKLASGIEGTEAPQLDEKTLALFRVPSLASWNAVHHAWLVNGHPSDAGGGPCVDFLLRYASLPLHRDPLATRGALEGFVVVRNDFYQQRIDRIVRDERVIQATFLDILPFHQLMGETCLKLKRLTAACVDLVLASRSASLLPVVSKLDIKDKPTNENEEKLLFLANCAENYADGLLTSEKQFLIDGFFSTDNAVIFHNEWERVVFLRFVVEDVVAPRTRVVLTGDDTGVSGGDSVALLPAELLVESSDEEEIEVEEESDCDDDDSEAHTRELLDASMREALLLQSSYAKRPTQWYTRKAGDTYLAKFHERLATVLEECRIVLTGLLLALDAKVRHQVCGDWYSSDEEGSDLPNQEPESESEDATLNNVALAYVLLVLRDGLLALPFFATQQFRWEDNKMLARHMVLQMLLQGRPEATNVSGQLRSAPVVSVKAREEKLNRTIAQLALGVDEIRVQSLQVHVHTESVGPPNSRTRSWRHQLKIQVRDWLQQIQWIQMTGDVASGQRLYERFSLVTDDSLRYRHFLLLQLGDPDATKKAAEAAGGGARRASTKTSDTHFASGGAASQEPLPKTPMQSMEVRYKLLGIRNPSHFSRDTIWIPPILELSELPEAPASTIQGEKQRCSSANMVSDETVAELDGKDDSDGGDDGLEPAETRENEPVKRVSLRVLPGDLSFAVEAAVLSIGVISDQEADAFKIPLA